eukprot:COSAG03_NODE_197_length_10799_cov_5.984579_7_plen_76_part_00
MIVSVTVAGTDNAVISKSDGGDVSIASVAEITDDADDDYGDYLVTLEAGATFGASGATTLANGTAWTRAARRVHC